TTWSISTIAYRSARPSWCNRRKALVRKALVRKALVRKALAPRKGRPRAGPLFSSVPLRRIARQALGSQFVEIGLPFAHTAAAKFQQVVPAEYPGRVQIVEREPHRVIAHRMDLQDRDVALAGHGLAL